MQDRQLRSRRGKENVNSLVVEKDLARSLEVKDLSVVGDALKVGERQEGNRSPAEKGHCRGGSEVGVRVE